MVILPYLTITLCALAGLAVALYVRWSKGVGEKIFCPTDSDCEVVIHSRYNNWRGILWEQIGIVYYSLIVIWYGMFILVPSLATSVTLGLSAIASVAASVAAGYLLYIQGKVLREWCTLCVLSSLMCFSILLATLALWL